MTFKHIALIGLAFAGLSACNSSTQEAPQTDSFLTSLKADYPVSFAKIDENVWVHTTNYTLPGQSPISSNGLVVLDGEDVVLIDGAWGELATVALLESIKTEVGKAVTKMVITHHHPDRIAGVDAAEREGIQVFTHADTPALAARNGYPVPNTSVASLKEPKSRSKIGALEVAFPGAAHASDNLVVYVPSSNVLYLGCALRGAEATTLGNLSDADIKSWPGALNWVKATYRDAQIVVPGHGKGGDLRLIDKTLQMLAEKVNSENSKEETP